MEEKKQEYLTEKQASDIRDMFKKYLDLYKEKDAEITDREWLEQLFSTEFPEMEEKNKQDSEDIIASIEIFNENLKSCNNAFMKGISKESWLANRIQETSVGMAINEYGKALSFMDNALYCKNVELSDALSRSSDGNIMMSPNLDGNIAENMVANTAELSALLQGKNISVSVLESYSANSIDVRAINHDTGQYQNYQLKFGKDAKSTIRLLERGNYNNQRIVVPSEQLEEIQTYFKEKGSSKTVTDHIDAWGAKGKSFTKEEMKVLQERAQKEGVSPEIDYSHYQTKDLAMSIGKNAGAMAIQTAAVTTGLNIAERIFNGENIETNELVNIAIKTGADTSIKTVTAGTLQIAIRRGVITFIPKATPAGVIANIACVGIENVKILAKIASGELSITKGIDQMGRVTTSMVGGLWGMTKGAAIGVSLTCWIPVIGGGLAVITGFVGGMIGYFGGSKLGNSIYSTGKKVANASKAIAKATWDGVKSVGKSIGSGIKSSVRTIANLLGF